MGSTDLVNQAIQGDREAFIRLIRDIENSLYNTAKSMLRKEEDVADAIQETILNAYKSVHTLREPRYFKTWLFRILINECNTMLSRRSLSTAYAEVPSEKREHSSPYDEVDMREAVDQLEESKRIVVVLHYFEDLSLRQVADALNISESAVKMRLTRARQELYQKFKNFREVNLHVKPV
ncbi:MULTISPECIES: sigma-70 family RNA polymerase sigma factor [Paenibacillus]|uniref:sigma-70 family RNA polymerase sigma factor n=1 Tax=Paenibacillus TaxID=44249 RepID=UPI000B87D9E2|nr:MULTISPECIES: sigma-70 family RNA polymerase sigma factor [Paenibacillus]PQZ98397.1 RNA polymerase [Paenibacillus sp. MYb63]PRA42723.1 RNA polymerase [Paenibacillus sp. MYb67]QZN77332.1 sigma-70 family RNA polymerase sigma factor [Paenibacillus sp. DR312]